MPCGKESEEKSLPDLFHEERDRSPECLSLQGVFARAYEVECLGPCTLVSCLTFCLRDLHLW